MALSPAIKHHIDRLVAEAQAAEWARVWNRDLPAAQHRLAQARRELEKHLS